MLNGIDVSVHNGLASTAGLGFAFVRACYGRSRDTKFEAHYANFRKAGIVVGAYAFGIYGDGAAQARAFLAIAGKCDLLALDLEKEANRPRMTDAQARDFIATVRATGRKIGLYHSASGFPKLGQSWNWVAKWGSVPPVGFWAFWQWRGSPLDRDYFQGDRTALYEMCDAPAPIPTPAPVPSVNPYPAGTMEWVGWYHSHGYSQVGGIWVNTAGVRPAPAPVPVIPPPITVPPVPPDHPLVTQADTIPLVPTMVEASVKYATWVPPTTANLGLYPAWLFGSAGPIFVLVHGGPAPLGNWWMLGELGGRLSIRGARAYCIDYRSDTWEHAVADVTAAVTDLRRLTSDPITLVSHSFGGIPALVVALRDGAVDAYVAVNSSVLTSYPGFPDAHALAKLHPTLPVSVVRGSGDSTGAEGREEFVAALHAAGHPGLNIMGPGDHTGTLYTEATLDAILATARMIP